mgnify:FL=1
MLVIVREERTDTAIIGSMFLNDTFICYTLENAAKAIPAGIYNVENGKSPKFKRELPLLYNKDVKASRGIRIHVGNDAVKDSSGCVPVGMGRKGDKLTESTPAETMVTMLCRNTTKLAIVEAVV